MLLDGFDDATPVFGEKKWNKRDAWIESPAMAAGKTNLSQALVGWEHVTGDSDLRVEVKMTEQPGKAGFVFGSREDGSEFYLIEIVHRAIDTAIYVRHYDGAEYHLKYTHAGTLAPEVRAGFVPVHVQIRGPELFVTVADMPAFRARVDGMVEGRVGFFVSGDTLNPDPGAVPPPRNHGVLIPDPGAVRATSGGGGSTCGDECGQSPAMKYWTLAGPAIALLALSSCGGFRSMWRGMKNEDLTSKPAPVLTSADWVLPAGASEPPQLDGEWRVYVFFTPD